VASPLASIPAIGLVALIHFGDRCVAWRRAGRVIQHTRGRIAK